MSGYYSNFIEVGSNISSYASAYSPVTNKIYSFPSGTPSNTLYIFDVSTNTTTTSTGKIASGNYVSATFSPSNNKIYALNSSTTSTTFINVYTIASDSSVSISLTSISNDYPNAWANGEYVPYNQCIYYMPYKEKRTVVVKTLDNSVNYINTNPYEEDILRGGVYSFKTNKIYSVPAGVVNLDFFFYAFNIVINVVDNTITYPSGFLYYTYTTNFFRFGVCDSNGNIYYFPDDTTNISIYDTNQDTFSSVINIGSKMVSSGALSPVNNKIYCSPASNGGNMYVFNTTNNTFSTIPTNNTLEYTTTLFASNKSLYATSRSANTKMLSLQYVLTPNYYYVNNVNASMPIGTIIPFVGSVPPATWRICDGSVYDISRNPVLHQILGTPSNALLPNLGAMYLRGSGIAPSNSAYNAGNVRNIQLDAIKSHTHTITETEHSHLYLAVNQVARDFGSKIGAVDLTTRQTDIAYTGVSINPTGTTTMPYSYGINYIIKMDNSFGLRFNIYSGYFDTNPNFFNNPTPLYPGISSGYTIEISSIATGTNQLIQQNVRDLFTVEWVGQFYAPVGGTWTFKTSSDDASYLYIGETLVVNNGGLHGITTKTGTIVLTAYTYYPIRILFGESSGNENMIVSFTPPGGTETTNGFGYYFSP